MAVHCKPGRNFERTTILYVRTHLVGRFGKPAPDIFIIFNTCTKLKKMGSRLVSIHYWVAQSFFQVEKMTANTEWE